jgi:membrane protease YdiL (CAAX protease family)
VTFEEAVEELESADDEPAAAATTELLRDSELIERIHAAGNANDLNPQERQRLIDRHGWFGRLALAYGLPDSDPQREPVVGAAKRVVIVLVTALSIVVIALVAGFVLLLISVILLATGMMRLAPYRPLRRKQSAVLLESFTVYVLLVAAAMAWGYFRIPGYEFGHLAALSGATIFGLLWMRLRGLSWRDLGTATGLRRDAGDDGGRHTIIVEMLYGAVGYVALLPVMVAGFAIMILLQILFPTDASHPIVDFLAGPWSVVLMIFFLAVIWAPLTEELFFRGAFFGHTRQWLWWPAAALMVGIIFAAIHPQGWTAIPVLGAVGFNLAVLRQWRGSLWPAIAGHALNNGFVLTFALMLLR